MIDKALYNYVLDKDIAIVNGSCIVSDDHDIIVRINKGSAKERTDILALSLPLTKEEILDNFSPRFVLWSIAKYDILSQYLRQVCLYIPQDNFKRIQNALNKKPSVGCSVVSYLYPYCKSMTLYGFDYLKDPKFKNENIFLRLMLRKKGTLVL